MFVASACFCTLHGEIIGFAYGPRDADASEGKWFGRESVYHC